MDLFVLVSYHLPCLFFVLLDIFVLVVDISLILLGAVIVPGIVDFLKVVLLDLFVPLVGVGDLLLQSAVVVLVVNVVVLLDIFVLFGYIFFWLFYWILSSY